MKLISFLLIASVSCFAQESHEGLVVCYFANWSNEVRGVKYDISKIDPFLCTHLVYAFLAIDLANNSVGPSDIHYDIDQGGFKRFNLLKITNPKLKTLASVGGKLAGPLDFSTIAATSERRSAFAKNVKQFLRKYRFDGLSLAWRDPNDPGGSLEDYYNYVLLAMEVKKEFELEELQNKSRLILEIAVPSNENVIKEGYDLENLAKYADYISLQTFDYYLSTDPFVHHHAPLYPLPGSVQTDYDYKLNVDSTLNFILSFGVPSSKVVLCIPTFGRSYILVDENFHSIGSSAESEGGAGNSTRKGEAGYKGFYELCSEVANENWTVVHVDPNVVGPYAYKEFNWIGYDDPDSARKKGAYAKEHNLAGLSFWSIDLDDFTGACTGEIYPIVNAAKRGYAAAKRPINKGNVAQLQKTENTPVDKPEQHIQTTIIEDRQYPQTSTAKTDQRYQTLAAKTEQPQTPMAKAQQRPQTPMEMAQQHPQNFLERTLQSAQNPMAKTSIPATSFPEQGILLSTPTQTESPKPSMEEPTSRESFRVSNNVGTERQNDTGGKIYQTISVWVVNNIFDFGDSEEAGNTDDTNLENMIPQIPEFVQNLFNNF